MKYYICSICGNLIEKIEDGGNTPSCCNRQMRELSPAMTDGSPLAHIPTYKIKEKSKDSFSLQKLKVCVGAEAHPMTSAHHIDWIEIETSKGVQRKTLLPDEKPEACFYLHKEEKLLGIYIYCNLHGVWFAPGP